MYKASENLPVSPDDSGYRDDIYSEALYIEKGTVC